MAGVYVAYERNILMDVERRSSVNINWTYVKEAISVRFHTTGEAKSAIYNCRVPYDDTSTETSLRA